MDTNEIAITRRRLARAGFALPQAAVDATNETEARSMAHTIIDRLPLPDLALAVFVFGSLEPDTADTEADHEHGLHAR